METRYLFIDGGCLRATLKNLSARYFDGDEIRINYDQLRGSHLKVFYYDAIPTQKEGERDDDYAARIKDRRDLHNHIASLDGYHVYEGDSRIRRKQVQQKEVDVMIAVDMLTHTFRGNMERATLIASDLDFKPLLDALVREGMFVELRYPLAETNQNLIDAADSRVPLGIDYLYQFLDRPSQNLLKLPQRHGRGKDGFAPGDAITIQNHPDLGEIGYCITDKGHCVYWNTPGNPEQIWVVEGEDYSIFCKYLQDLFSVDMPEVPPGR